MSHSFGRRALRIAVLSLVVMIAGMLGANAGTASAMPSKYMLELCDSALPGGNSPELTFHSNPGVPIQSFNSCSQPGGSVGVQEYGATGNTFAYLNVAVPAVFGGWVESESLAAGAYLLGPGNDHSYVHDEAWPTSGTGEFARTFFEHSEAAPLHSGGEFEIVLNCDGNYAPGCGAGPILYAHYISALEVDPSSPLLLFPKGSIYGSGILRGHQTLEAEASDMGGGVSRLEVLVNGVPAVSPTLGGCNVAQIDNSVYKGLAALTPSPCPGVLKSNWTLDTAAPPFQTGANTVQVCASDFATVGEANKSCTALHTVSIDNTCTESPIAGGEVIAAQFDRSHGEDVTVPYGKTAKVSGELSDNAGDPVSGATICVQMQTQGSPKGLVPVGTTTTDASGHFIYAVNGGPNRRVLLGYRHDSFQVARAINYYAHVKPSIRLSKARVRRGGKIEITCKLPGGHLAARRAVVFEAAALNSDQWYPFGKSTTGSRGHYNFIFPFDETTRTTTYRIRTAVPNQDDYLYEGGHSAPALIEVVVGKHSRHRHKENQDGRQQNAKAGQHRSSHRTRRTPSRTRRGCDRSLVGSGGGSHSRCAPPQDHR